MISVIIPTCERVEWLGRCLESLIGDAEIIVSDDGRRIEARQFLSERFPKVLWLEGPGRGPAANRNHGARHASGEWLAFIDDDCIPESAWLSEISRILPGAEVIEGKTVCTGKTSHPLEEIVENLTGGRLWSCNFAIRRNLFERLGGFDEDFLEAGGEDMEFAWRIRQMKIPVAYVPTAIVCHPARRLNLSKWVGRIFKLRWHLLYRLKVTRTRCATLREIVNLLWVTAGTLRRLERTRLVQSASRLALQWILLPVLVPYLGFWEIKFRRKISTRR
jgi:GT2 family glycosyltransferase